AFEAETQLRRADRLAAIGRLTTNLAHEIRNPLGSIRGAAEILADPATTGEQRDEFSRAIIEETERLDRVLGTFLDYARERRGQTAATARLPEIMERMVALLEKPARRARVTVHADLPADLPAVAIEPGLLQQVLMNLMLNAVQAMEGGGGGRLEVGSAAAQGRVRISVSDTGPGIPEDLREQIFEPFFTTKAEGSGLGLA